MAAAPEAWLPKFSPRGGVALLGIAQRSIRMKFSQKLRRQKQDKPLQDGINTIGDWIQVKRIEKNLSVYHLCPRRARSPTPTFSSVR
jgi:hypothetical protein